ncbi:Uncharacterised protein [Klebsiella pneumoniae]|nr:Uncharacterised protein [Klebsiella pneumoniae]
MVQTGIHLQNAVTQRCRDAKDRAYNSENINRMAYRPVYAIANNGIECGAQS